MFLRSADRLLTLYPQGLVSQLLAIAKRNEGGNNFHREKESKENGRLHFLLVEFSEKCECRVLLKWFDRVSRSF